MGLMALLLSSAAIDVLRLPTMELQPVLAALPSSLLWLPVLYAVVALIYAWRFWRWRLLLGRLGIGRMNWQDLLGCFRGFALTAIPARGA